MQDGGGGCDPVPVPGEARDARARVDAVSRLPCHPLPATPGVRRTYTSFVLRYVYNCLNVFKKKQKMASKAIKRTTRTVTKLTTK